MEEILTKKIRGDVDVSQMEDNVVCVTMKKFLTGDALYIAVRGDWPLSKERGNKTDYVLAEYKGVVIGVFKTDEKGWFKVDPEPGKEGKKRNWHRFDGAAVDDPNVLDRYLYKRLPAKRKGASNSFRYFEKRK